MIQDVGILAGKPGGTDRDIQQVYGVQGETEVWLTALGEVKDSGSKSLLNA